MLRRGEVFVERGMAPALGEQPAAVVEICGLDGFRE
jgi:hypothetical protein